MQALCEFQKRGGGGRTLEREANLRLKPATIRLIVIPWAILCAALYLGSAGIRSVIREDMMDNWAGLAPKLARFSLVPYLGSWIWAIVGALVFSCAFVAVGDALLGRQSLSIRLKEGTASSRLAYLVTSYILGQGVLSVLFLALAIEGWLAPLWTGLTAAAAIIIGIPAARGCLALSKSPAPPAIVRALAGKYKLLLVLALLTLSLSLLFVTSRISFDASAAYFSDAKLAALTHQAPYFTTFGFTTSAVQSSINYAAIIQLFGDQAARLYSWLAGLGLIVLALALAAELGLSVKARVILLTLIVTTTSLMDLLGDGKVDLISSAPAMAAIYWLMANSKREGNGLAIVGALAGMAMMERPFNLFLMPAILALIGVLQVLSGQRRKEPREYGSLALSWMRIGLGALPWIAWILISNWGVLGNPLAVFTEYIRLRSGAYPLAFPANAVWLFRLLYPLSVTFINHGQSLGNISPLLVGLAPVLLARPVRKGILASQPLRISAGAALLTLVLWLIGTSMVFETRYIIFLWIMLYMPAALWMASALDNADGLTKAFVGLALVFMLVFMSVRTLYFAIDTYSPVDAQGSAHCYDMDRCVPLQVVNDTARPGERVLMLNAFRYYLRTDLFACSSTHQTYDKLWALSHTDMNAFWTEVYRQGYTYVVYEWDYVLGHLYFGAYPSPGNTPPWLDLVPLYGKPGDKQVVYRVSAHKPPVQVEQQCMIDQSGLWSIMPGEN